MKIQDGLGRGYEAIVTSEQRLAVMADTISFLSIEANESNAFVAFSGLQTLTSSNESAVLYLQNTDPESDIMVQIFDIAIGWTSGTGNKDVIFRAYSNPLSGTIITSGTAVTPGNLDIASRIGPVCVVRQGGEGKTQGGGNLAATRVLQSPYVFINQLPIVIRRGASICWTIQPPPANTSMQMTMNVFFANIEGPEFAGPA